MRQLRQMCAAFVLVLVFTTLTFANDGIIHTGYLPTPTPTPTISTTGIIHTGLTDYGVEPEGEDGTLEVATELALSVVQSVLAMF